MVFDEVLCSRVGLDHSAKGAIGPAMDCCLFFASISGCSAAGCFNTIPSLIILLNFMPKARLIETDRSGL